MEYVAHGGGVQFGRAIFMGIIAGAFMLAWGGAVFYGVSKMLREGKQNAAANFLRSMHASYRAPLTIALAPLAVIFAVGLIMDVSKIAHFESPVGLWFQLSGISSILAGLIAATILAGGSAPR